MLRLAAVATFFSLLVPVLAYYSYPQKAEPLAADIASAYSRPLNAGLEVVRGVKGHARVEGIALPAPGMMMHMVLVDTGKGRVAVSLAGCWEAPDGRVYMGHMLAQAVQGLKIEAYGLLVKTRLGPVLVAEEVKAGGVTLKRTHCTMHTPGQGWWGGHGGTCCQHGPTG